MSTADPIKVVLRVRPLLQHERNAGNVSCISIYENVSQVQVQDPGSAGPESTYSYNHVFGPGSPDVKVFKSSVEPMLPQLFEGYNVTVLAYGQTGSGKTYSMGTSCGLEGGNANGVIPKSVNWIFQRIAACKDAHCSVTVSFLELYQEQIRDLLNRDLSPGNEATGSLEVREDPDQGIHIPGLTSVQVDSVEKTLQVLAQGSQYRSTGATAMNKTSSRSHAIFTIVIERTPIDDGAATISKFSLVDLAGSERVKKTGATGQRFKEGVNINQGLMNLGTVINLLGDELTRKGHIPYRSCKLTRLLQESLGGNSYTLMIACVSPADANMAETLNTLRYADRALKIKNKPVVNTDSKAAEIGNLREQLQNLRRVLEMERQTRARGGGACPPGHQRLIELIKTELETDPDSTDGPVMARIRSASPRTRLQLRQIGLPLSVSDDEFEDEGEMEVGASPLKPRLFPALPGLKEEEEDAVDPELETEQYHEMDAQLQSELKDVDREIQLKQSALNELDSALDLEEMEARQARLQQQVDELVREKRALEEELQKSSNKASAQLAEQRRLQIRDLEKRITQQNKQLSDLTRLRMERKQHVDRIKGLSTEIQSLKQMRVRLTREIKKSSDNYRQWQQKQKLQVGRLEEAARRGRNQLDKQAKMFARKQAVLQRKYDEAVAANKRLQNRHQLAAVNAMSGGTALETWLEHELDTQRSICVTRDTLDQMVAEKHSMQEQLAEISMSKVWLDYAGRVRRQNQTRYLQSQIALQTSHIQDLEQKLCGPVVGDDGGKLNARWNRITSLADARQLLQSLFGKAVNAERETFIEKERASEIEERLKEVESKCEALAFQNKELQVQLRKKEEEASLMPPPFSTVTPLRNQDPNRSAAVNSVLKNTDRKSLFRHPCPQYAYEEDPAYVSTEEVDDESKDPTVNTPLLMKDLRGRSALPKRVKRSGSLEEKTEKPSRCACKGKCDSKRCSCFKTSGACSENCSCQPEVCTSRPGSSTAGVDLNDTFVVEKDDDSLLCQPTSTPASSADSSTGSGSLKRLSNATASSDEVIPKTVERPPNKKRRLFRCVDGENDSSYN